MSTVQPNTLSTEVHPNEVFITKWISLQWRVSKLIFARAQNDHCQNGILQSQIVANGHGNYLSLVKGAKFAGFS